MAGPTDNAGTCRILYEVVSADGLEPEIFVVKQYPPRYAGAEPLVIWQHVAYADEMTSVPTTVENPKQQSLVRKASVVVEYPSLDAAAEAVRSIRKQTKRLVDEIKILETYTETKTWVISSID